MVPGHALDHYLVTKAVEHHVTGGDAVGVAGALTRDTRQPGAVFYLVAPTITTSNAQKNPLPQQNVAIAVLYKTAVPNTLGLSVVRGSIHRPRSHRQRYPDLSGHAVTKRGVNFPQAANYQDRQKMRTKSSGRKGGGGGGKGGGGGE